MSQGTQRYKAMLEAIQKTSYFEYAADKVTLEENTSVTTELDETAQQLLFYPAEDSYVKLNENEDEIFLPGEQWTPVSVLTVKFTLESSTAGDVHWQAWF